MKKQVFWSILGGFSAVVLMVGTASASHSWGGYHWARKANPFTLKVGDNMTSTWDNHLDTAISDWSTSTVLDLIKVAGGTTAKNCRPTAGRVEACNAKYGNNGWLGIAQIWLTTGNHITKGTMKMNDTYFNTATYNKPAWRQLVVCQELAHDLGLDHQDENFNNPNLGSCMDYTSDPSSNQHPNAHDYQQLETIYNGHLDSVNTAFQSVGGKNAAQNADESSDPKTWGRAGKHDSKGHVSHFERQVSNDEKIVTFVIWAE